MALQSAFGSRRMARRARAREQFGDRHLNP
jgi:hypothetical protein